MNISICKTMRLSLILCMSLLLVCVGPLPALLATFAHSMLVVVRESGPAEASTGCLQPPQNKSLLTLTDAQLVLYGLPTHATINTNPQHWAYLLAHAKHHRCNGSARQRQMALQHVASAARCIAGLCSTGNWSGPVAIADVGTYHAAEVQFEIPAISTTNRDARVSLWAGLGGWSGTSGGQHAVVVQTGVDVSVNQQGQQTNVAWWEVAPNLNEQPFPLTNLHVGDHIVAYVESNLNASGYDYFWLENLSAGANEYSENYLYGMHNYGDQATAECIVERVSDSVGNLFPLAHFSSRQAVDSVSMWGCQVGRSGQASRSRQAVVHDIGGEPHFLTQIYNTHGAVLTTISPLTASNAFSITWHGSR